jgi:serine/threonine-protein kinase RsbW
LASSLSEGDGVEHTQQTFKLSVPSDTVNLAMIRDFVEVSVRRSTIEEADMEKLKLAVDEACANVIEHAYDNDNTHEITVHVWFDDARIEVDVIDSGSPFDPHSHKSLMLEDLVGRTGGMGIRIMKMATDELVADTDEHGHNRLRLIKRLAK